MNQDLFSLIQDFIKRYPQIFEIGELTSTTDFDNLNPDLIKKLPIWYSELLRTFPIAGAEIGIPNDFGQSNLKGLPLKELPILTITMNDLATLEQETIECFPGCELIKVGYLCVAKDEQTTHEGIYIDLKIEDSPLFLVYHDLGETNLELIKNAEKLLDKFSDLFKLGKIEN